MINQFPVASKIASMWALLVYSALVNILFWMARSAENTQHFLYVLPLFLPLLLYARWFKVVKKKLFLFALSGWFTVFHLLLSDHKIDIAVNNEKYTPLSNSFYIISTISLLLIILFFIIKKPKEKAVSDLSMD